MSAGLSVEESEYVTTWVLEIALVVVFKTKLDLEEGTGLNSTSPFRSRRRLASERSFFRLRDKGIAEAPKTKFVYA